MDLTPESLARELTRRTELIHDEIEQAMAKAAANVEGRGKVYCTPGESPYETQQSRKAPFITGFLRSKMASDVILDGHDIVGRVGNSASYAVMVHEGTSRMGGRPFILDAIEDEKEKTAAILAAGGAKGCR